MAEPVKIIAEQQPFEEWLDAEISKAFSVIDGMTSIGAEPPNKYDFGCAIGFFRALMRVKKELED